MGSEIRVLGKFQMDIESEASAGAGNRLEHGNIDYFMEDEDNIEQFLPDWQLIGKII